MQDRQSFIFYRGAFQDRQSFIFYRGAFQDRQSFIFYRGAFQDRQPLTKQYISPAIEFVVGALFKGEERTNSSTQYIFKGEAVRARSSDCKVLGCRVSGVGCRVFRLQGGKWEIQHCPVFGVMCLGFCS